MTVGLFETYCCRDQNVVLVAVDKRWKAPTSVDLRRSRRPLAYNRDILTMNKPTMIDFSLYLTRWHGKYMHSRTHKKRTVFIRRSFTFKLCRLSTQNYCLHPPLQPTALRAPKPTPLSPSQQRPQTIAGVITRAPRSRASAGRTFSPHIVDQVGH